VCLSAGSRPTSASAAQDMSMGCDYDCYDECDDDDSDDGCAGASGKQHHTMEVYVAPHEGLRAGCFPACKGVEFIGNKHTNI